MATMTIEEIFDHLRSKEGVWLTTAVTTATSS